MEKIPPSFRIDFEDGTFGNFIKVASIPSGKHLLENISGMKYGRQDAEAHTFDILDALMENPLVHGHLLPEIINAAESVIADYYASQNKSILVYDLDRDEYVVYIFDERDEKKNYAVRVTRMIKGIVYNHGLEGKDLFVDATFDYPSLVNNLKFEMEEAVKTEDYESAARFRDVAEALVRKEKSKPNRRKGK